MGSCSSIVQTSPTKNPEPKPIPLKNKSIPKSLKKKVWDHYIGANVGMAKCMCCDHQIIRQIEFHCGHVVAEACGGKMSVENMRPICSQCNLSMGKTNLLEFQKNFIV